MKRIGIIGSGSWATALVKIISDGGNSCVWWVRKTETADYIKTHLHNPDYLTSVEIDTNSVLITSDLQWLLNNSDIIILVVPSAFIHQSLEGCSLPLNKIYVSAIKGIEPKTQQVIAKYLEIEHKIDSQQVAIITGPCHAEEVAAQKLSYLTVAANNLEVALLVKSIIASEFIRVSCNTDLIGSEYASVMKNIYAIGAGIAHGLGYGDNYLALYTSCAIREMKTFLSLVEPNHRDVNEAAYLGDLLVTCYSQFSRNRTFGNMLGKGYNVKAAQLEMNMIAEGYYATKLIYNQCQDLKINLPIADTVYQIIYENRNVKDIFRTLSDKHLE